jgi:hypothetical protein
VTPITRSIIAMVEAFAAESPDERDVALTVSQGFFAALARESEPPFLEEHRLPASLTIWTPRLRVTVHPTP